MRCTLRYTGSGQPEHLRAATRVKGILFEAGKSVEVSAELAGQILANCEGFELVSGEPKAWATSTQATREALKAERSRGDRFAADPAAALSGLPKVPAAVLKMSAEDIAAGKADEHLFGLAVSATIGGKDAIAKAAVDRQAAILAAE